MSGKRAKALRKAMQAPTAAQVQEAHVLARADEDPGVRQHLGLMRMLRQAYRIAKKQYRELPSRQKAEANRGR